MSRRVFLPATYVSLYGAGRTIHTTAVIEIVGDGRGWIRFENRNVYVVESADGWTGRI